MTSPWPRRPFRRWLRSAPAIIARRTGRLRAARHTARHPAGDAHLVRAMLAIADRRLAGLRDGLAANQRPPLRVDRERWLQAITRNAKTVTADDLKE